MEDFSHWQRYEVLEKIAEGGMGKVYKAFDPKLKRYVALKFVKGDSDDVVKRFIQEAQSQGQLVHENICRIYEVGEYNHTPYIAMQYISGGTLAENAHSMNLEQKVHVMKSVAEAVHEAHRHGIIHRDIKPPNIMLEKSPEGKWIPFIMDFGLAREVESPSMTMSGMIIGTANYMSPEQAHGDKEKIDRRSDVFSLGSTMYELLTGKLAFPGETPMQILLKVIDPDPQPLSKINPAISQDLETIVMKCLEKDSLRRYDSARSLAEDLQRFINGDPVLAQPPTLLYRVGKKAKKHKAAVSVGLTAFVILMVLTGMWLHARWQSGKIAEIARNFGREVTNIENVIRISHTIPLHDIGPEYRQVKSRMQDIRNQMASLGDLGDGPGHYALGWGNLAIQDYDNARIHFYKSWNSGYQNQDTAYALGITLSKIYRTKWNQIQKIDQEELRKLRLEELDRKYLKPALEFLKKSRGIRDKSPEYMEALIAFNENKYNLAIEKARVAFKNTPWMYEAKFFEGDVYQLLGNQAKRKGALGEAFKHYNKAEKAFREALAVGESDPQSYRNLCHLWDDIIGIYLYEKGEDFTPFAEKSLAMLQQATIADPYSSKTYQLKASTYESLGFYAVNRGDNPGKHFKNAIKNAELSSQLQPDVAAPYLCTGNSYLYLGYFQLLQGKNPLDLFKKAFANYKKAINTEPKESSNYSSLGVAYAYQAQYEIGNGLNPARSLDNARDNFLKAIELNPAPYDDYSNLGGISQLRANYQSTHGENPLESLNQAIECYRKAIALNPITYAYRNLGISLVDLADYKSSHGLNPRKTLQEAEKVYEKVIKINKESPWAFNSLGNVYASRVNFQIANGEAPERNFKRAIQNFKRSIHLNSNSINPYVNAAAAMTRMGDYYLMQGQNPGKLIREATGFLAKAQGINPKDTDVYSLWLELILLENRYNIQQSKAPNKQRRRFLSLTKKLNSIDDSLDGCYRQMAIDLILQARWKVSTRLNPAGDFSKATKLLEKAISLNGLRADNYYFYSQLLKYQAQWLISRSKKGDHRIKSLLKQGIGMANKALSINPQMARALALKGSLHLLSADIEEETGQKERRQSKGKEAIKKALEINKHLSRYYKI
jgi:serine/threonine-protein kinase